MAVTSINWNDGSGDKIYVDPGSGTGNGTVQISSDPNTSTSPRSKDITFSAPGPGGISLMDTVTVTQKGKPNYFWTEAIASGTFTLTIPSSVTTAMLEYVSYSTDNGVTWTKTNNVDNTAVTITTPTISAGDKVLWKGVGTKLASAATNGNYSYFRGSANYNIGGDIASLLTGDSCSLADASSYAFARLFDGDTKLINAEDLILSPSTIRRSVYQYTFENCTNLETAPIISASYCYDLYPMCGMFYGCKKLVVAPELNFTRISRSCCEEMFRGCTELTTPPPELNATTVDSFRQFYRMFYGCTKLTSAPIIRLLTLPTYSCYQMFYNCKALSYIKLMATNISAGSCLENWVYGVAATGTFVKNSAATWDVTGASGVPSGWTIETASS